MSPPAGPRPRATSTGSLMFAATTSSLMLLPNLRQCLFFLAPSLDKPASSGSGDKRQSEDSQEIARTTSALYGTKMVLDRRRGGKIESELMMALRLIDDGDDVDEKSRQETSELDEAGPRGSTNKERLTTCYYEPAEASECGRVDENNNNIIASTTSGCSGRDDREDNDQDRAGQQQQHKYATDGNCTRGAEQIVCEHERATRVDCNNELTSAAKVELATLGIRLRGDEDGNMTKRAQVDDQFKQIGSYLRQISDEFERLASILC